MKKRLIILASLVLAVMQSGAGAAIITVTTTNNLSPGAAEVSLVQALTRAQNGDEIRFQIPGTGPFYIPTPAEGYPLITANNVTIDGYTQPGASPNSNPILSPNIAKIQIVLDSRSGGHRNMGKDFPGLSPADDPGYTDKEGTVLGFVGAKGCRVAGLSFLGVPRVGLDSDVALYFISFAKGASGQIGGCWLGVDPDGKTVAGASGGITGLRYQARDQGGNVTAAILVDNLVIGVPAFGAIAVQNFNVLVGMPSIPIIIEGNNTRISGNFIMVLPDGLHDVDVALDEKLSGDFGGAIEIGRGGNNTLIGTDGDGSNDENERNIFGGMVPSTMGGYDHLIEFYSQNPGTNIVIAGNYFGVGIDGKTKFTNGIPVLNAAGANAHYRLGSNFDNLSDPAEGNLIANNYPSSLFPASDFHQAPQNLNFFSELTASTAVSMRGNSLLNNFPFPVSPLWGDGQFLTEYYATVLADASAGVVPVLSSNSTVLQLKGTVPKTDGVVYTATVIDLYLADPIGVTNGIAADIPELPQGFVQGMTYIGSFVENSAADSDKERGTFQFNLARFNLPAGTQVTVAATYLAPVGAIRAPTLDGIARTDNGVLITWTGLAVLQSAATVGGPWVEIATSGNSYESPATDSERYFRLLAQESEGGGTGGPPITSPFSNIVEVR